jgi:hypothetical protein
VFFILVTLYLVFSSLQISYGFSIMKKPSSVFQYYNTWGSLGCDIYCAVPLLMELRVIIDFAMSRTSLDMFQCLQLFYMH